MGLAIDASSPSVFTSSVAAATSASFTPPLGSLLVVRMAANSTNGVNPSTPTITDNRGVPLTYTLQVWRSRVDGSPVIDGQCAIWTAPVTSSVAMTVTVTTSGAAHKGCRIDVITGHHRTNPIGVFGKAGSASASSISQNYTAAASAGQGFMSILDWDALGAMTAGSGCTLDGTGDVGVGQISYGFVRRTQADDRGGVANTLNGSPNGTSTALNWCWLEILEDPIAPPIVRMPLSLLRRLIMQKRLGHQFAEAVAGPLIVEIGQVSESSTAQAFTSLKTLATGQVTETSTAQALTANKRLAVGQVTETSTAQAVTYKTTRLISQVTETSTAQALNRRKAQLINQIVETATAQAITSRKTVAVAQATESSTANAVGHTKRKEVGQVSETSAANSVVSPGAPIVIGQVSESNSAQAISVRKVQVISQVVETNTANGLARTKTKLVVQANETGLAQVIVRFNVPIVVQVNESNLARQVTGGTAAEDTHGWRPLVGLHCVYLQQKTFGGNSQYIKRRNVIITGFASDGYPILLQKQSGEVYGTASVGVRPRSHPDADEFDVYVSY